MPTVDDLWASIGTPVAEMRAGFGADPATPWIELRQSFLTQLAPDIGQSPAIQQFLQQLDDMTDVDRNAVLGSDQLESLAYSLLEQNAQGDEDARYDEEAWEAYLADNGAAWDGTDEGWQQFREWFSYYADEQGLSVPATELLEVLDTQSVTDRIATLASRGVTITPAELAGNAVTSYDEQAWQDFLAANGPEWDGTGDSWDQFRDWFSYHAAEQQLGTPANGLLEFLDAQPVAERIETFAEYGVTISPAASAVGPAVSDPGTVADEDEELDGEQLELQLRALFDIPPDQPIAIVP